MFFGRDRCGSVCPSVCSWVGPPKWSMYFKLDMSELVAVEVGGPWQVLVNKIWTAHWGDVSKDTLLSERSSVKKAKMPKSFLCDNFAAYGPLQPTSSTDNNVSVPGVLAQFLALQIFSLFLLLLPHNTCHARNAVYTVVWCLSRSYIVSKRLKIQP